MSLSFTEENKARVDRIVSLYPNNMAACLPLLYVAQDQFGHLSPEAMDLVAETLELAPSHVYGVATFYTMYNKKPVGQFHVQACTNVSCMLCGAYDVMTKLEQVLGIKRGQTSKDGLFTLTEVECLAFCGTAPVVQVNDDIHELVSPDKVEGLIKELRAKAGK